MTHIPVFDTRDLSDTIKPHDDLNAFVNKKWLAANPIPADRVSWGAFEQLREKSLEQQRTLVEEAANNLSQTKAGSIKEKIGRLYQAGMDTQAINKRGFDPIKADIEAIDQLTSNQDVAHFIMANYRQGNGYVFLFGAGADFDDATRQIGFVFQGGLGLPTRDYYLEETYQRIRQAYCEYIRDCFVLTGTPEDKAQTQAKAVLDMETTLAKASLAPTQLRQLENQYRLLTLEEANQVSPHFQWDVFFEQQGLARPDGFSMGQPDFIRAFNALLADAPTRQWQAYLAFHLIDGAAPYLSEAFETRHFTFHGKTLMGQPEQRPRWKRVLDHVNQAMAMALGEIYVAKHFPPENKSRAQALVDNVSRALKTHILDLEWMSTETKDKALAKWKQFLPKIGYPDPGHWRDWEGLAIEPGHYFENIKAACQYNYRHDLEKIGTPTDRYEWHMSPQTVNAYYDPSTNTINFPAAILQPPFFYAEGDAAINYGGIGAVIGHEATHGFDDQGRQFDGLGNRCNWWKDTDKHQFEALTQALVEQFNAYTPIPEKPDLHVNGELTLGENIADLGGLAIAWTALQTALSNEDNHTPETIDGYTQAQRFFLNWARVWRYNIRPEAAEIRLQTDPHAPASIRAMAAPSNLPAFATAFDCPPECPMVRKKPIKIW